MVASSYRLNCGEYSFTYKATWAGQEEGVKVLRRVMQRAAERAAADHRGRRGTGGETSGGHRLSLAGGGATLPVASPLIRVS